MRRVEEEVRQRIAQKGRLTFAEFMELALFWPSGGYYSSPERVGARGDYYTAPGAHPAFGALLCLQLYQMWELLGQPRPFWVVEMGAGDGLLCLAVMQASASMPGEFASSLRYLCLDRWPRRGYEAGLRQELAGRVDRLASETLPLNGVVGCFLSNELLDSFPVHRVTVKDGRLQEVYVTLQDGDFVEQMGELSSPRLEERARRLGLSLPEGHVVEINLALEEWVAGLAWALERGFVLTIDYGHTASELYSPRRPRGTLTCYYQHVQVSNPYQRIGRQDMTAHVDFTSVVEYGRAHGLDALALTTQGRFLANLGLGVWLSRLARMGLRQRELQANRMGMLELARPGGMGDFKVLVQGKAVDVSARRLWGLGEGEKPAFVEDLPVPLLAPQHMPLLEGRYPHWGGQWLETWTLSEGEKG